MSLGLGRGLLYDPVPLLGEGNPLWSQPAPPSGEGGLLLFSFPEMYWSSLVFQGW